MLNRQMAIWVCCLLFLISLLCLLPVEKNKTPHKPVDISDLAYLSSRLQEEAEAFPGVSSAWVLVYPEDMVQTTLKNPNIQVSAGILQVTGEQPEPTSKLIVLAGITCSPLIDFNQRMNLYSQLSLALRKKDPHIAKTLVTAQPDYTEAIKSWSEELKCRGDLGDLQNEIKKLQMQLEPGSF